MVQKDKILEYLKTHKGITQRQAIYMGVYRLSDVIFRLKKDGHSIATEMKKVRNVDGTYSMIADYHLIGDKERNR